MKKLFCFLMLITICIFAQNSMFKMNLPLGGYVQYIAQTSSGCIFALLDNQTIYRSVDRGQTWEKLNAPAGNYLNIYTNGSNEVYLFDASSYFLNYSSDLGSTWVSRESVMSSLNISSVQITPCGYIYAYSWYSNSIYRSTNKGVSWQKTGATSFSGGNIYAFASNGLYMFSSNTVYYSANEGSSWISLFQGPARVINIFRSSAGNIFATFFNNRIFRSTDNGATWNKMAFMANCTFSQHDNLPGYIFAVTPTSIFYSNDEGNSWTELDFSFNICRPSLVVTTYKDILIPTSGCGVLRTNLTDNNWNLFGIVPVRIVKTASTSDNIVYAINSDNVLKTTNNGQSWSFVPSKGLSYISDIKLSPDKALFITSSNIPFKSSNQGKNWSAIANLPDLNIRYFYPRNDSCYFVVTNYYSQLYSTQDNGANWQRVTPVNGQIIYGALAFDYKNQALFACDSGLYVSNNLGASWRRTPLPTVNYFSISDMLCNSNNDILTVIGGSIYQSANAGESWEMVNRQIPQGTVRQIATNSPGHLFAVNSQGNCYISTDHASAWSLIPGPVINNILDLKVSSNGYIFACTDSFLYRSQYSTLAVDDNALKFHKNYALDQNYPNPFNPSTTISYSLTSAGNVTLKIYDVLGKEVKALVHEYQASGQHKVVFRAADLPSGVYIYTLRAGAFTQSKKLMLLK